MKKIAGEQIEKLITELDRVLAKFEEDDLVVDSIILKKEFTKSLDCDSGRRWKVVKDPKTGEWIVVPC